MKRILFCSVALATLVSTAQDYDTWTDPTTGTKWLYFVQDEEVVIKASSSYKEAFDLTIPSEIDDRPVTRIDKGAFECFGSITNITIPSSVKSVGLNAFFGCSKLSAISIPNGVTNIGSDAFGFCHSLKDVVLPNGLTAIGSTTFRACTSMDSISIPKSVTDIGDGAFSYCSSLRNIEIPESVTYLGDEMFHGCSSLSAVSIPDGIQRIGVSFFQGCSKLTSLQLPESLTEIGASCFNSCDSLDSLTFNGDMPEITAGDDEEDLEVFRDASVDMIVSIKQGTAGWTNEIGNLKKRWPRNTINGRPLVYIGTNPADSGTVVNLIVTNVIVHYVLNSVQPNSATPISSDTGFTTVITEVKSSGAVSVPSEWKDNYPTFESKFGTDFGKALMSQTGKKDSANNDMLVWQDFVAGTDPTKKDDVFTASITLVDGVPNISYTPELSDEQKALRTYKTFAKKQLQDEEWIDFTNLDGVSKKSYNFFKVTVEMK